MGLYVHVVDITPNVFLFSLTLLYHFIFFTLVNVSPQELVAFLYNIHFYTIHRRNSLDWSYKEGLLDLKMELQRRFTRSQNGATKNDY